MSCKRVPDEIERNGAACTVTSGGNGFCQWGYLTMVITDKKKIDGLGVLGGTNDA